MSKLGDLTTKRMELFALERETCAACGHWLAMHAPRMSAPNRVCHSIRERCKCKGWIDPSDRLPLGEVVE